MNLPIVVAEPVHFIGAVTKCSACGKLHRVVSVHPEWVDAPDPDTGDKNKFAFALLDNGAIVRVWQRG